MRSEKWWGREKGCWVGRGRDVVMTVGCNSVNNATLWSNKLGVQSHLSCCLCEIFCQLTLNRRHHVPAFRRNSRLICLSFSTFLDFLSVFLTVFNTFYVESQKDHPPYAIFTVVKLHFFVNSVLCDMYLELSHMWPTWYLKTDRLYSALKLCMINHRCWRIQWWFLDHVDEVMLLAVGVDNRDDRTPFNAVKSSWCVPTTRPT